MLPSSYFIKKDGLIMKKFINKNFLNSDLISQTFNIKKENIIGMFVDESYFKIIISKNIIKRRLKNGYYTSNSFKTYKSSFRT